MVWIERSKPFLAYSSFLQTYHLCMMNPSEKKMRKIVPQNGHLLCKMVEGKTKKTVGFECEVENIPIYEILELSYPLSMSGIGEGLLNLKVGDQVVCNSTGTLVQDGEDEILYLFKLENVAAKVID